MVAKKRGCLELSKPGQVQQQPNKKELFETSSSKALQDIKGKKHKRKISHLVEGRAPLGNSKGKIFSTYPSNLISPEEEDVPAVSPVPLLPINSLSPGIVLQPESHSEIRENQKSFRASLPSPTSCFGRYKRPPRTCYNSDPNTSSCSSETELRNGSEVYLRDRHGHESKYHVHYVCCRMTRVEANKFLRGKL